MFAEFEFSISCSIDICVYAGEIWFWVVSKFFEDIFVSPELFGGSGDAAKEGVGALETNGPERGNANEIYRRMIVV